MHWFPKYNYILASKSPRRKELLQALGIEFEIKTREVAEDFPHHLSKVEIPVYLAQIKATPFINELTANDLLITADTIVWQNGKILGKPQNKIEAIKMLSSLSGQEHQVITGVCLSSHQKQKSFYSQTVVTFKTLEEQEILYYLEKFKPFDKAGSYGIQEWIGFVAITHIQGSFYNVMGLPVQKLYEEIQKF